MARSCFSREVYASQKNCRKLVMKRTLLGIVSRYFQIANWFHRCAFRNAKSQYLRLQILSFGQYWNRQMIAQRWMIQSLIFSPKFPRNCLFWCITLTVLHLSKGKDVILPQKMIIFQNCKDQSRRKNSKL